MQDNKIRIGSYNLENFFAIDTDDQSAGAKPAAQVAALRHSLDELDLDILAVQEVDGQATLMALNGTLRRPFEFCGVEPGNYYRGLHLGYLSRYPLTFTSYRDTRLVDQDGGPLRDYADPAAARAGQLGSLRFQRDLLRADVETGSTSTPLTLFNLHLKSQAPSDWRRLDQETIRHAEAGCAARLVAAFCAARPDSAVIVLGDLNAESDDPTVAALVVDLGLEDILQSAWTEAGNKPIYTYHKLPHRRRLDYLLVNARARDRVVSASPTIHRSKHSRRASDHYPVSLAVSV